MATLNVISTAGAANYPVTNETKIDLWAKRQRAYGAIAPLTKILSRLAVNKSHNVVIDVIEENKMPTTVIVAETESTVGTTIKVQAYGTTLVKDTQLYNPVTNDIRTVDSTPAANTVTVTINAAGTTSSTVWSAGDQIEVLLPQLAENDSSVRPVSVRSSRVFNYQQLAKLQYSVTRTNNAQKTNFGGPGEFRKVLRSQKAWEFAEKTEKLKMFGGRGTSGSGASIKRAAGGLNHFLRSGTLYKNFSGSFTESGFDNWLGDYSDQNPSVNRVDFLCAPNILRQINYFAKDKIRISPDQKKYGLNLNMYIGGPLEVNLIRAPLLTGPALSGWGWLLDFTRIRLQDLEKTMWHGDAYDIGVNETILDTFRENTSMLVSNETRHAMCTGATLAA